MKDWQKPFEIMPVGKGKKLKDGKNVAILSIGAIGNIAAEAIIKAQESGINAAHYDMIFLKPIDEELLHEIGKNYKRIITVENGAIKGGLGTAVMEFMMENGYTPQITRIGIPDRFIEHGTIPQLYHLCGMDAESITKAIINKK
jgi:1-deoxy-D-xylulose-5-phosphate synthase